MITIFTKYIAEDEHFIPSIILNVMLSLSDWVLRTDANLDGDSLSYMDMLERNSAEERRRERERAMMEEGKALWKIKMDEEKEIELRSQQQVGRADRTFLVYSAAADFV